MCVAHHLTVHMHESLRGRWQHRVGMAVLIILVESVFWLDQGKYC